MAWTAPRTWTTGEVLTAALLNTHVRDNELFLFASDPSFYHQNLIEQAVTKGLGILGAATNATLATADQVGAGFVVVLGATGAISCDASGTNAIHGAWRHDTGATSGSQCAFVGSYMETVGDYTLVWRGVLTSAASQTQFIGFHAFTGNYVADENNIIGFRVSATGTIVGVCDAAGTETTRDTTVTPDGATECSLRVEVRSGGTIVRFYRNNVQVGADVTTNIPAGTTNMNPAVGIQNSAAASKVMYTYDAAYWREAA